MEIVFLDKKTFEVSENFREDTFKVDELLAKTIALLNKSGYRTIASSAGNLYAGEFIDTIMSDEDSKISKVAFELPQNGNIHHLRIPVINTKSYITFENIEELPTLPKGYEKIGNSIYRFISYVENYDTFFEDGKSDVFLPNYKVEKEIIKSSQILWDWAKSICE